MKGRKPQLVRMEAGNTSKRKPRASVVVPTGVFDPPFELTPIARVEWDRILAEAPWLRAAHSALLAERCECFADIVSARADINARGNLIETRNGAVKNPSLQILRESRTALIRMDTELGITPCSQNKVGTVDTGPQVDALEAQLCG